VAVEKLLRAKIRKNKISFRGELELVTVAKSALAVVLLCVVSERGMSQENPTSPFDAEVQMLHGAAYP